MTERDLDDEIARLFQLSLSEFTIARNVLAKRAGPRAAGIRALPKPPVAAWAINQLFWRDRATYDVLIAAAEDVRAAHASLLAGRTGDVRATGKAHEEAITTAMKAVLGLLREDGHPATDTTRQAVATTLRALPGSEVPGRLTSTLAPGGFEMLAGLPVHGRAAAPRDAPLPKETSGPARAGRAPKVDADAQRRTKEEAEEAARAVRLAEHAAQREAFEAARTGRVAEKAASAVSAAREAVSEAERALEEAEKAAAAASAARNEASERAREASAALEHARGRTRALRQAKG